MERNQTYYWDRPELNGDLFNPENLEPFDPTVLLNEETSNLKLTAAEREELEKLAAEKNNIR